jgi:hypothetical protein
MGWLESVIFVSLLSLWALVETAFAAWRADEQPELKQIIANQEAILEKLDVRPPKE